MIRFSAFLVAVAVGLLVAGVVTSKLMLVYIAIGVSGVALLALGIGAAVNWRELTSKSTTAAAGASAPDPAQVQEAAARDSAAREATVPATAGAAATGSGRPAAVPATPSRAGYLPTAQPQQANPAAPRPAAPADPVPPAVQPQPATPAPAPAAQATAASTPRREPPARDAARDIWEWREDSVQAPPSSRPQALPQPAEATPQPAAAPAEAEPDAEPAANASDPEPAADATASPQAEEPGQAPERADQPEQAKEPDQAGPDPDAEVTVVPGVPRYHNARCILIRFMGENDLDKMTRAAAREAGCTPCRACLPDQPDKSPE